MLTTAPLVDLAALGDQFTRDPYPVYAALRAKGPVHRVRIPEGADAWLVIGSRRAAPSSPTSGSPSTGAAPRPRSGSARQSAGSSMLGSDAPDHTRLRKLVAREFTPRSMEQLAPRIQEMADELLDAMLAAPDRSADLVEALSFPLPMSVICELLGVPFLDREDFRTWSGQAVSAIDPSVRASSTQAMTAYIAGLLARGPAERADPHRRRGSDRRARN
ncbi:cytochrome P450 [Streptomyces badius]